ncbi:MAG: DUF1810 domain-containing protein [Alphaproteobacteria bacterium]|nr:DUF1810 domain-containing protein [Alphaproteobacteria bacterium]
MEAARDDPFHLARFVAAQAPVIERVRAELSRGAKRSHWMWFVFPQLAGLGKSPTARAYALASLDEAKAFFAHPVLGARLCELTGLVLDAGPDATARGIFGAPDDLKFHSCMTLFARAAPREAPFRRALARFFDGREDGATLALLAA